MSVFNLKAGESAKITKISVTGAARDRLTALGITCGAKVTCLGFSLFNSSILLGVNAVRVALRKGVASAIEVA